MPRLLLTFRFPDVGADGRLGARAWLIALAINILQASTVAWGLAVLR